VKCEEKIEKEQGVITIPRNSRMSNKGVLKIYFF